MTCPNCGKEYSYGSTCPYCEVDTVLYAGTLRMSDALYNKGLIKVKVSDLSGALDCLTKSIAVNKNNTQARNLLGLVQYEIGHIGDALKNWVISCGLQKEDNPATEYIESIQKNARTLERINDSVRIYNQALSDIWQKSDDMAIIKLKQSIDINPKFIDALNLLTFCYLIQKDKAKAQETAEKVLAIDSNNTIALNYYTEINPNGRSMSGAERANRRQSRSNSTNSTKEESDIIPYKKVVLHERRNVNFHIEGILALVIGIVCTLGVMYVLVFPALDRSRANQIEDMQFRLEQSESAFDALLEERDHEINFLQETIAEYVDNLDTLAQQYDALDRTFNILNAFELLRENRFREAADALGTVDLEGLQPDIVDRAWDVMNAAFPELARQYYNEGVSAYNGGDFERARVLFEQAYRYAMHGDAAFYGEVIYYLAFTFSQPNMDTERAIRYFQRLLEEFPNHARTGPATSRLSAIS